MISIDISTPAAAKKALSEAARQFLKFGAPLAQPPELGSAIRRTSGISYREVHMLFKDGQEVKLLVKMTGDIFQVLLNGRPFPINRQDDLHGAIREMVDGLNARRAARQKRLAATKILVPDGIKASRRVKEIHLRSQLASLTQMVEDAKQELSQLTS